MKSHARTYLIILLALCLLPQTAMSQKLFTLEELNYGGRDYQKTQPENRRFRWWGEQLTEPKKDKVVLINAKTGHETTLFTLDEVNQWLQLDEDKALKSLQNVQFPYPTEPLLMVQSGGERRLIDFQKHAQVWHQSAAKQQFADWNKQSRAVAFVRDNQLFVLSADGKETQLTTDGSRDIVYGQSVHRNEWGISKGTFWSPDGQQLAFYRMDQSMVADYPQVNVFHRIAEEEPDKYPMAGETSHQVTVGIYNLLTGKTIYLDAGDPTDRYFTNISWSPDAKKLFIFELNRDQNDCQLVQYNAATGEREAILDIETSDKYVEPSHPIVFLPWDSSRFLLQSQRDGYNHIYLYRADGTLERQLTQGEWVVLNVLGFDVKNRSIVFESNEQHPLQRNIYSVNVKTGKRRLLDNGRGYHYGLLSDEGAMLVDNYSEPTVPRVINLLSTHPRTSSPRTAPLLNLLTAEDPWKDYQQPIFESGSIKVADGQTDLYYRMVKPADFSPEKQYPTVIYVYGGPHAHNVDARWHYSSRSWETYMAQKGYLLFILDNRGSENRGRDFEQVTFRELGQREMEDQMEGVRFLRSLPYVDAYRMGVHGWSFGGFMTISLMLNHPDVFKVGVAGGPVIDWQYYEVMYGERYMDTPQTNPEGYEKTSLLNKAQNLKGKLQIITGYNDDTVVPQHCLLFLEKCIEAGVQPDFFVYPGEPHNMRGRKSVHLHERITQYFEENLK